MTDKKAAQSSETQEAAQETPKAALPTVAEMMSGDNAPKIDVALEAEDNNQESAEQTQPEEKKEPTPPSKEETPTEEHNYEAEAREDGWAPKDEFKGDPKLWVDSKEWISRGPLLHKITQQSKELKSIRKTNEALAEMMRNMTERNDKQVVDEIYAQRKESIEQGDVVAFEKHDKEYSEAVENAKKMAEKLPGTPSLPEETAAFVERNNKWFNDNPENIDLREYAVQVEKNLMNTRPELTLEQRLRATENIVKDDPRYKSRYSNPNRDRPAAVEAKTTPQPRNNKITFAELPSDVKRLFLNQKRLTPDLDLEKMAQAALDTGAVKYE